MRVHGRTLLDYALEGALASGVAEHVVVTVPADCSGELPGAFGGCPPCRCVDYYRW